MKRLAFCAVLVIATAAPAAAQGVSLLKFGITGGYVYPYATMKDYAKSGWDGGLTLQIGAPLVPVAFRVDGLYTQMNGKTFTVGPATGSSNFTVWSATGNVVWTIIGSALPTKLYLIGGIGYYNVQQKEDLTAPVPGTATLTQTAFGYNAGLGVRFTKIFIEARWNHASNALVQLDGSKASLEFIPLNVGLLF